MVYILKKLGMSLAFCLLIIGLTQGQGVSTFKTQFSLPDSYDGMVLSPSVEFIFNQHGWSIGPTFLWSFGDQIEARETFKLTGLYIGYDNFLHGKDQKFNLYHSIDFYFQRIKDVQASQYFDTVTSSFQPFEIKQIDHVVQLFANFGILINLSDKVSLSQSIGLGLNATFRSTTSPFENFSDPFIAQDWLIKTGLNYRLSE